MIKTKNRYFKLFSLSLAVLAAAFFAFTSYQKSSASMCDLLDGDKKDECEKLEEKQETYEKIIDLKQKQATTLGNQLEVINQEQGKVQTEISDTEEEIKKLDEQIKELADAIKNKEEMISARKKVLAGLLQTYYEVDATDALEVSLKSNSLSEFFSESDYMGQLQSEVNEMVDTIKFAKQELVNQRVELDEKNNRNKQAKQDLVNKVYYLESSEKQKQNLLSQTQGEEAKYKDKLARVEEQKMQLLNLDELAGESGLSANDFDKPKKGLASTSWYYSQRDSRWGSSYIGNSKSKLKDYGCAVSAVAMVFTYHGGDITPKTLAKQPIFYWDLISWPNSWPAAGVKVSNEGSYHGNIDWDEIDDALDDDLPVIVYIGKTNGAGGHYVVIHHKKSGKYIVHDPYWGPNLYLDTSRALVGALSPSSGTKMDQMIIYKD